MHALLEAPHMHAHDKGRLAEETPCRWRSEEGRSGGSSGIMKFCFKINDFELHIFFKKKSNDLGWRNDLNQVVVLEEIQNFPTQIFYLNSLHIKYT